MMKRVSALAAFLALAAAAAAPAAPSTFSAPRRDVGSAIDRARLSNPSLTAIFLSPVVRSLNPSAARDKANAQPQRRQRPSSHDPPRPGTHLRSYWSPRNPRCDVLRQRSSTGHPDRRRP